MALLIVSTLMTLVMLRGQTLSFKEGTCHTTSFSGLIQLLSGNWTSNLINRSPFSKGFRYCGMPSPRTTLTEPEKNKHMVWLKHIRFNQISAITV